MKSTWVGYEQMLRATELLLDARSADMSKPSFAQSFDTMVSLCATAGPEELLRDSTGDFASCGHVLIYEKWRESPCECDGWILTILQGDSGYMLQKIGAEQMVHHFSHEEPRWTPELECLLENTLWRPLNWERLIAD